MFTCVYLRFLCSPDLRLFASFAPVIDQKHRVYGKQPIQNTPTESQTAFRTQIHHGEKTG